ncbi:MULTISPECIES: YciK family oxidoreductase [Marinobacter]|jgi:NAD(P)-dependent dehydrogenase (short-subunit alcohol dehydrogenase family)|uniref:Short-chain dehydrogenase/reductase SDR n=1 Tax=Marinobacter nauticus (strain ATCC 700491 / DSM 11845 / VT8) TaxID=351348 RepID=A1U3K3_MARN8|nr:MULTISPECIES: YciK family oxidoreductase [Marinobacter]MEC8822681.1 YciK family oxidoreductase [Pseudomonadota bacterium]ABM19572.1 short-chain dehydrogenase/reductase SDR [Marinobacter nauticus VT8]MBY5963746.1 YciK family oxidoreductase [Marinobacter nauticus]MCS5560284.1 YciK family oxidoreductase [Marinobacter nauticus]MEC9040717.1 YciK family oxidoreductase [Pseudomonadota bacterium]|tara:strand:- start:245 stop:997 length:753 start_codon:yes stop_codon:yes gene_type:complete
MQDYQAPADLLKDRIVMVTGAGSGIGRAAAKAYAAHGATVILVGRTVSRLEEVYDEIEAAGHPKPAIVPMNFEGAAVKDYEELAMTLEDNFGRLDGLLHNAGILGARSPVELYDPETWNKVMHVNATAPFLLSRAMIPLLRKSEDASMIFTSSGVGRQARAYWGAYAVSKFAVEGLAQLLADELDDERHNIRVNSLNPGATRTGMRVLAYPAEDPKKNPDPEQLMPIYLYLMGRDSKGVHGQQIDAQPKK